MGSENLLKLVLQNNSYSQKDLAKKLEVSPAQISKWKTGEYMSSEMEEKMKSLADIGDRHPDLVYWTGGTEQADKWSKLISHLASEANEDNECSYETTPLLDELDLLAWDVIHSLIEAGASIPNIFPSEIDFDYDMEYTENEHLFEKLYNENNYSSLIYNALKELANLYDFYVAYFSDLIDDDLELFSTGACNIEPCLLNLALAKIGKDEAILTNFKIFRYETLKNYKAWIEVVKHKAISNRIPLKAELMNLVSNNSEALVHEAEAEAFGFNSSRLHPDIYMDEILKSHRMIHQVLPAICKKLGITEKDLVIDETELKL